MKHTIVIALALLGAVANATEMSSHSVSPSQLFFDYASWVPDSVSKEKTPGSDCTMKVLTTTNESAGAWTLSGASKTEWTTLGEPSYYKETFPIWNGSQWSGVGAIFNLQGSSWSGGYVQVYDYSRDEFAATNKWADRIRYNISARVIVDPGETVADESCWAIFERSVTNDVHSVTNVCALRLTPEVHASFARTLDGWCEREYFGGLAYPEPDHTLDEAILATIPSNRTVTSRRLTGIDNLLAVGGKLQALGTNEWRFAEDLTNGYTYAVRPYWSTQSFDDILGDQLPEAIDWNGYGLDTLTNKCAALRGVTNTTAWRSSASSSTMFPEMVPTDFAFGLGGYHVGGPVPSLGLSFEDLCLKSHVSIVNQITNETRRLDNEYWGAINQAMSEMNRTFNPIGPITAEPGQAITYTLVRGFETDTQTFEDAGMDFDESTYQWVASSDIYFTFREATNYWEITTNAWSAGSLDSDAVELTKNTVTLTTNAREDWGHCYIGAAEIAQALNSQGVSGEAGIDYPATITSVYASGDTVIVTYSCGGMTFTRMFDRKPENTALAVAVYARNSYTFRSVNAPDFESFKLMPMTQAWSSGSALRVKRCRDVCTASIGIFDTTTTNIVMHCNPITRDVDTNCYGVHTNEWNRHHAKILNDVQTRRGLDWSDMKSYVSFTRSNVDGYLSSVALEQGNYGFGWTAGPVSSQNIMRVNADGDWYVGSGNGFDIAATSSSGFVWDGDESAHTITQRLPLSEYCRQRIMNIVDWNWNSVRKQ